MSALSYQRSFSATFAGGKHDYSTDSFLHVFASHFVFGITHRETTRDMVRYGLYCFAMFLSGVLVAGWAMWLVRR